MWRRPAAHDTLRGGTCTAYARRKMVVAEGMGVRVAQDAGCVERSSRSPGVWLSFCTGCGLMAASSGGARTAPRFLRLPEAAAENAGETAINEINAFCFGRKMSSRGRRVG